MNDPEREQALRDHITSLNAAFLTRTRGQLSVMAELVTRLHAADADAAVELRSLAHKIHGSGAMFGFPDISEPAGEIERTAKQLCAAPDVVAEPGVVRRLAEVIQHLTARVDSALSS